MAFQAVGWGLASGLAYLITHAGLTRDYFSAHRTAKTSLELLAPALAVSAGIGFLFVGLGSALSLWRYSRRLHAPLSEIDGLLRRLGSGQVPAPAPPGRRQGPADEAAALLEPLRGRVEEIRRITKGIQKSVLELNYRAGSGGDLRGIAGQLDALARELGEAVGWFEG